MFQLLCVHILYDSYIWHYSSFLLFGALPLGRLSDSPLFLISLYFPVCIFSVCLSHSCSIVMWLYYMLFIYMPQFARFYFLVLSPLAGYLIAICFYFPISFYLHNLCVFVSLRLFYSIHGYVYIRSFYVFGAPPLCLYYSPLFLFPVFFLVNMFSVCSY